MKVDNMFNWLRRNNKHKKPIIIMIHGFGVRRRDEFNNLIEAIKDDFDYCAPNLFNQEFKEDDKWYNWVSKAEEEIIKAKNNKREIVLIGFSMGGVIATYLAGKFNVKKLILLAPAFDYATMTTAKGQIKHALNKKPSYDVEKYKKLPSNFTNTFMNVVDNCKKNIYKVECPVLMMAAIDDETISYNVSLKYYEKIPHDNKKCIIFADGQHRLLDDDRLSKMIIKNIIDFIYNEI